MTGSSLFWHVTVRRLRNIPEERISHLHRGLSEITTDDGFRRIRMLTFVHTDFSGISFPAKYYQNYRNNNKKNRKWPRPGVSSYTRFDSRTLEGHLNKNHALIKQNISDWFSDFLFLPIPLETSNYS